MQWTVGRALDGLTVAAVTPLFDAMLAHSADAFAVTVELMGMYARGDADQLQLVFYSVCGHAEAQV